MTQDQKTFANQIKAEVTSLALCCKLTLKDGTVLKFTNSTEDLFIDESVYKATTLAGLSSIETTDSFSVDNLDITGILNSVDIKEHEVVSGRYDFAQIEISAVNCTDLSHPVIQRRGWLGEVTVQQDGKFVAEVRGLAQKLQCNIGELYSSSCRAAFGDSRCKVALGEYTHAGVVERVDAATDQQSFVAQNMDKPDGYFALGEITWLTGKNRSLRMEIKEFTGSQFILALGMPHAIDKGDTFTAVAGCDKVFATCCGKFKNAVNFRGEPHVPGRDKMLEGP